MLTKEDVFGIVDLTFKEEGLGPVLMDSFRAQVNPKDWDSFEEHLKQLIHEDVLSSLSSFDDPLIAISKGDRYHSFAQPQSPQQFNVNVQGNAHGMQVGNQNTMTISENDAEAIERVIRALADNKDPGLLEKVKGLLGSGLSAINFIKGIGSLI